MLKVGMLHGIEIRSDEIADEWAIRSEFWQGEAASPKRVRRKRERNAQPLILCGHGVSLRIENGALVIRDGFTHYPQEQARYRFFPRDLELPTRILLLDGSGTLSFDVLNWLADQGVALARIKWTGEVATVAGGNGYAADPAKLDWQKETRGNPAKRHAFAANLIRLKVVASLDTLERCIPDTRARQMATGKARAAIERLQVEVFPDLNAIFAVEGECASSYFAAWHGLPVHWIGLSRRPVPNDWQCYSGRSSLAVGIKPENRNASHPINAMLNYAYAVKLSQLQIDTIAGGFDPRLGIMHNSHKGTPALVLDFIELERPRVDAKILELVATRKFAAADFIVKDDGVCRLSPQLARAVAILTVQCKPFGLPTTL
ncbi:MAG: CRISPR-associated endonuclease Cas1 [Sphingomicrobium sp.]